VYEETLTGRPHDTSVQKSYQWLLKCGCSWTSCPGRTADKSAKKTREREREREREKGARSRWINWYQIRLNKNQIRSTHVWWMSTDRSQSRTGPSRHSCQIWPRSASPRPGARRQQSESVHYKGQLHAMVWFILRPCQHDDGYIDGRLQIKVHTDERIQVHSARSSLAVTHPSTSRGRRCLTSVNATELALVSTLGQ